jgi:hypothetical protein
VIAEIVLWFDGDGRVRLDANFDDGEYIRAVLDGDELVEHEASPAADLRVAELGQTAAAGWSCALHVVEMVAGCVGPLIVCPLTMVLAACACADDFAEEHPVLCS